MPLDAVATELSRTRARPARNHVGRSTISPEKGMKTVPIHHFSPGYGMSPEAAPHSPACRKTASCAEGGIARRTVARGVIQASPAVLRLAGRKTPALRGGRFDGVCP